MLFYYYFKWLNFLPAFSIHAGITAETLSRLKKKPLAINFSDMENDKSIPTPYQYAGGVEKFEILTDVFYVKVLKDEILEPIFRHMAAEHSRHVAHFLAEVFMGPKFYSNEFGDESLRRMVGKHIGKKLTEQQRKRWVELLMQSADEIELPNDPEFRSVFAGHIEWGTRVAIINSNLDENPTTNEEVIPEWGWGEVKGPYEIVGSLFQQSKTKGTDK